jgi:hypothetical protein
MNVNSLSVLVTQFQNIQIVLLQTNAVYYCKRHIIFYKCMPIRKRICRSYVYMGLLWSTRYRVWLRHCTTSRKVAGSIPDCVIGMFHWHNPSCRTMALGLTASNTGVGELFYLLPQNIFIYADVTPLIWKGENHRLFKFKGLGAFLYRSV